MLIVRLISFLFVEWLDKRDKGMTYAFDLWA